PLAVYRVWLDFDLVEVRSAKRQFVPRSAPATGHGAGDGHFGPPDYGRSGRTWRYGVGQRLFAGFGEARTSGAGVRRFLNHRKRGHSTSLEPDKLWRHDDAALGSHERGQPECASGE